MPRPTSPYGPSKLAGEAYCSAFAGSYGVPATVLRFSNVYGPFSYHKGSVVAAFCKQAMAGQPLVVYGDGTQTRDFVFVEDLARAVVLLCSRDASWVAGQVLVVDGGYTTYGAAHPGATITKATG